MNERRRLPAERNGVTHRFLIRAADGAHKGYVTTGLYDDGTVGEIFFKMDSQGSTVSGLLDAWAIAVSMLLQTGTTLEAICRKYRGVQFEPAGMTDSDTIRIAKSPIDYVVRWLQEKYVGKGV